MPRATRSENDGLSSEASLAIISRPLTRCIDMFWCPTELLSLGRKIARMDGQAELALQAAASPKDKRMLALLDKLNDLDPTVVVRLVQGGSFTGPLTRDAKKQLRTGQSDGKSEDMRKVKIVIGTWRNWDPPLPGPDEKVNRGLAHVECAYLLSDQSVNWENQDSRNQFILYGNPPMRASAWGRFLWPWGQYNPDRVSDGLLKSELMVKAARAILFSPAASKNLQVGATTGARGHRRRGPIGIAKSYDLTAVTPAFLAYVAVVLRHALTADETFGDSCGGFNYIDFYEQIRDYLERPSQLFSEYNLGQIPAPFDNGVNGTLAGLEAEMEADEEAQNGEEVQEV
ncbi:hypothetical protein FRC06_009585 [Ceratobasidium sp. 370]|nr:hypothetical protein FRC06_009585 [Ceratobasidium sp. 370]